MAWASEIRGILTKAKNNYGHTPNMTALVDYAAARLIHPTESQQQLPSTQSKNT
jgi:hypothetical protein